MPAFRNPEIDRFVAALFVVTLVFCHGAFGALHVVADPVAADPALGALSAEGHVSAHHASGHHDGAGHEERQASHAGAEYFAVLLGTFFGGLALWAMLRNDPRRAGTFPATWLSWCTPPAVFSLPRGPTLPLLQVFRL